MVGTKRMVGRCTASAIASASRKSFFCPFKKGLTYKQLAERLEAMGNHETERNINNKISRGGFSATFFVQCLIAIGNHTLHLEDT